MKVPIDIRPVLAGDREFILGLIPVRAKVSPADWRDREPLHAFREEGLREAADAIQGSSPGEKRGTVQAEIDTHPIKGM